MQIFAPGKYHSQLYTLNISIITQLKSYPYYNKWQSSQIPYEIPGIQ